MFEMFDDLYLDDGFASDGKYAAESGSYFDCNNMYMDSAIESFMSVDAYDDDESAEYFYAIEAALNAMDTDLEAIAMEVSYAAGAEMIANDKKKSVGSNVKAIPGNVRNGIKKGILKILDGIYNISKSRYNKLNGKGKDNTVGARFWYKLMLNTDRARNYLRGADTPEAIDNVRKVAENLKNQADAKLEEERTSKNSSGASSSSNNSDDPHGVKAHMARNLHDAKMKERKAQKATNLSESEINRRKKSATILKINATRAKRVTGIHGVNPNTESYIVTDSDAGYSVAVEGLFSKPKTGEKLLEKMQKKVGRLKSIGACDDMLRQLNAEASKFNSAIAELKKASAEYSETNDKKALRRAAGPVLKDLNKTCKLLKIKSIAADPKNISQEEIKKLHDFITGAKQLITARKKVLSGAATESVISGFDDDFEYVAEGYGDDDFLSLMQDDYDDVDIADEALIEDFVEADQTIAVATEGIIDPDTKRAHRIKFGEKKRQIKSIVKKARAAKKAKDFASAIAMYQEAKKGYQGLLAEAKKIPDRATGAYQKDARTAPSDAKRMLINWCIKKMGECDNAIEAIRNGQMREERKAAAKEARAAKKAAKRGETFESYLDDALEYESVIESLNSEDEFDDIFGDEFDSDCDFGEYDGEDSLESLLL